MKARGNIAETLGGLPRPIRNTGVLPNPRMTNEYPLPASMAFEEGSCCGLSGQTSPSL
jgi:hypothetical protein